MSKYAGNTPDHAELSPETATPKVSVDVVTSDAEPAPAPDGDIIREGVSAAAENVLSPRNAALRKFSTHYAKRFDYHLKALASFLGSLVTDDEDLSKDLHAIASSLQRLYHEFNSFMKNSAASYRVSEKPQLTER